LSRLCKKTYATIKKIHLSFKTFLTMRNYLKREKNLLK